MGSGRGTELILILASTLRVNGLPCQCEPFVEPDLFPDLESFFAAEGATLDQAMDPAVGEAVCVTGVVESVGERSRLEMERRERFWDCGRLFEVDEFLEVKIFCHSITDGFKMMEVVITIYLGDTNKHTES